MRTIPITACTVNVVTNGVGTTADVPASADGAVTLLIGFLTVTLSAETIRTLEYLSFDAEATAPALQSCRGCGRVGAAAVCGGCDPFR